MEKEVKVLASAWPLRGLVWAHAVLTFSAPVSYVLRLERMTRT